jgi:hypothetical protein
LKRGELLQHPLYLSGLFALLVNDHYLKRVHPGLVSGRLSDFAGLCVFPALLVSLLELAHLVSSDERARGFSACTCGLLSAVVFTLVETWNPATHAYRVAFGALRSIPTLIGSALSGQPLVIELASQTPDRGDLWALPCAFTAALLCTEKRWRPACLLGFAWVWRRSRVRCRTKR